MLQKLLVPDFVIKGMYINGSYYLPTFFFESIFCILGFIIILLLRKKIKKTGLVTAFYLIWYGILRFIIEIFRTDSLMLFNLKVAMIVSGLMIILGIILLVIIIRKNKE
jgi:phosphatidylglycerol:prolipoprotein diacylglycerol transferase